MRKSIQFTNPDLIELANLQKKAGAALLALNNGGLRPPDKLYEEFLSLARQLLQDMIRYNETSPKKFDLQGFSRHLAQQLSIYAYHRKNDGDQYGAKQLLRESDDIIAHYLGAADTAVEKRSRAMDALAEGRFHDALIGLEEAGIVFEREGDVLQSVQTESQRANTYEWLGDYESALQILDKSYNKVADKLSKGAPSLEDVISAISRQISSIVDQGINTKEGTDLMMLQRFAYEVVQTRARINRLLKKYDEAEHLFYQARPFAMERGIVEAIDYHFARIACDRGDFKEAERITNQIAPVFNMNPMFRPKLGALRILQADIYLFKGRPDLALEAAQNGLADQITYPDLDLEWKLQWRRARALSELRRYDEAIEAYRMGLNVADHLRMAPLGYRLDTTFIRDKLPIAQDAINLALECGDADSVALFIELIKSRALAATLSIPRFPTAEQTEDEKLFDKISMQIDALSFSYFSNPTDGRALKERINLFTERDNLISKIRLHDSRWRNMTEPSSIDLDAIRSQLRNRVILTLFHEGNRVVAVAIDEKGSCAGVKDLEGKTVDAINKFTSNLRSSTPNDRLSDLSGVEGIGLEELLQEDVIQCIKGAETLIIVPHGVLHLLPWSCLTIGNQRIFELSEVGILPNLASFPLLDVVQVNNPVVALIGSADYSKLKLYSNLDDSLLEIKDVENIHGERVVRPILTGSDATEESFWNLAEVCRGSNALLHFSGHGNLQANEPLASGLILTDSMVDAAEIMLRRLPYREVVLSGCSTAWRPQTIHNIELLGDDALGLVASFLESGATFVVANTPKVHDKASRMFTVSWHRNRRAGMRPLEAYRATQMELYAADPEIIYSWAGTAAYGCL